MKKILYNIAASFILPLIILGAVIYIILQILQLLFRTINLQLEKGMRWIDRNITPNIR